jgi:hypothetical protein
LNRSFLPDLPQEFIKKPLKRGFFMNGWGTRIIPPILGLHPFGAALRAFKIAPGDFVEQGPNIEPTSI